MLARQHRVDGEARHRKRRVRPCGRTVRRLADREIEIEPYPHASLAGCMGRGPKLLPRDHLQPDMETHLVGKLLGQQLHSVASGISQRLGPVYPAGTVAVLDHP